MTYLLKVKIVETSDALPAPGDLRKRELQLQEEKRDITIIGSDSSCERDRDDDDVMADTTDNLSDESLVEDEGDDCDQDEVNNHYHEASAKSALCSLIGLLSIANEVMI